MAMYSFQSSKTKVSDGYVLGSNKSSWWLLCIMELYILMTGRRHPPSGAGAGADPLSM